MTKHGYLQLLKLLSALESWSFSASNPVPDYLLERMDEMIDALEKEILKEDVCTQLTMASRVALFGNENGERWTVTTKTRTMRLKLLHVLFAG